MQTKLFEDLVWSESVNQESIDVFFSASFHEHDKGINEHFNAICKGLGIRGENVSFGAKRIPHEQARKMIRECQGLIAVCTKREELANGSFNMPQAVNDEIAFACGLGKPILVLMEKGVNKGGFTEKFGTFQSFDREALSASESIEGTVKAIASFKADVLADAGFNEAREHQDSFADELTHLIELRCDKGEFVWEYSTVKRIVYTERSDRSFQTAVFTVQDIEAPKEASPIEWEMETLDSTQGITLNESIETHTAQQVTSRLRPDPPAEPGDYVKYRTFARHRYLVPLWSDEVVKKKTLHLDSGRFDVGDGVLFLHRTKKATIEFRFCREYGLSEKDVVPFVASYTNDIDFEVSSELKRANVRVENFGGAVTVRMEIESALPGHLYGIAWNPRENPRQGKIELT